MKETIVWVLVKSVCIWYYSYVFNKEIMTPCWTESQPTAIGDKQVQHFGAKMLICLGCHLEFVRGRTCK